MCLKFDYMAKYIVYKRRFPKKIVHKSPELSTGSFMCWGCGARFRRRRNLTAHQDIYWPMCFESIPSLDNQLGTK